MASSRMAADAQPLTTLKSDDIVIAVMGVTGCGKSTFISKLIGQDVGIGHDLESYTAGVAIYSFVYKHTKRIYLIDTPGFDDTHRSDTDVLKDVAFFLSQTYKQNIRLAGIVYLHRITDRRMAGSSLKNLTMFKKLCGEQAYKHVVLATTMWENLSGPGLSFDVGLEREAELKSKKDWWQIMHQRGSLVTRHNDNQESALKIIDYLLQLHEKVALDIQKQMVDQNKHLEQTSAGQEVERELIATKKKCAKDLIELTVEHQEALADRDVHLAETLAEQKRQVQELIRKKDKQQQDLRIDFEHLRHEKTRELRKLYSDFEDAERSFKQLLATKDLEMERAKAAQMRADQEHADAIRELRQETEKVRRGIRDKEMQNQVADAQRARDEKSRLQQMQEEMTKRLNVQKAQTEAKEQETLQKLETLEAQLAERRNGLGRKLLSATVGLSQVTLGVLALDPGNVLSGLEKVFGGQSDVEGY